MKNISSVLTIFVLIIAMFYIGYISYLTFYPFKVIDFSNPQSLPVNKEIYRPGEIIGISFSYEKYMDVAPEVKKELLCDKTSPTLLREPRRLPIGKHRGDRAITIDHTIPLDAIADTNCSVTLKTKPFDILQ